MKTLLHACCGPCSVQCVASLRQEGMEPTLFWYNPNIHPFTEYRSRKEALVELARREGLECILRDAYGLRAFLAEVGMDWDRRCPACYRLRMEATAQCAADQGFERFTTSLLISPYQNHELLRQTGEEAAARHGVTFLYRDFRPLFREGQRQAREMGLYMQKYCGCIFSEEDRYQKKPKAPKDPTP